MRPFFLFYADDNRVRSVLRSCAINCGLDEAEPWLDEAEPWLDEAEPSRGSSGVLPINNLGALQEILDQLAELLYAAQGKMPGVVLLQILQVFSREEHHLVAGAPGLFLELLPAMEEVIFRLNIFPVF